MGRGSGGQRSLGPGCGVKGSLQVGERREGLLENLRRKLLILPFCVTLILALARMWDKNEPVWSYDPEDSSPKALISFKRFPLLPFPL